MPLHRRPIRCRRIFTSDLIFGIVIGVLLGVLTFDTNLFRFGSPLDHLPTPEPEFLRTTLANDLQTSTISSDISSISNSSRTIAQQLAEEIRILCLVFTTPANHLTRAIYVKNTWGKHCNTLLFMSSTRDPMIDSIALNVSVGRKYLWIKTKMSFQYAFDHYLDKADWFLKADDDSFVIMENLRYFLMNRRAADPVYFGCHFKRYAKNGYMSGGAGYVLSRTAVKRFVKIGLVVRSVHCTKGIGLSEDVEMGKCMSAVGVEMGDTIDVNNGGYRFNPFRPGTHLNNAQPAWFHRYISRLQPSGMNCCSDSAISFHYIKQDEMTVMYYLTYVLQVNGKEEQNHNGTF